MVSICIFCCFLELMPRGEPQTNATTCAAKEPLTPTPPALRKPLHALGSLYAADGKPSERAVMLAAYLRSLRQDYSSPEAPLK